VIEKKAYAKVNIFLKIVGKKDGYHLLASRFVRVKNLFDIIKFEKGEFGSFVLEGKFGCELKSNTIYKGYLELLKIAPHIKEFFRKYKVVVEKNIPEFAGLGGGSSDCATFLLMVNDLCNLCLSKDDLSKIGLKIGADVPFFIYEYDSANVTGIGEIVKRFDEEILQIQTFTPKIKCDTKKIFQIYSKFFYEKTSKDIVEILLNTKSKKIFNTFNIEEANDLYLPAIKINPHLNIENLALKQKYLFSGSGSSFFTIF